MNPPTATRPSAVRTDRIEHVAGHLLPNAALVTRLLVKQLRTDISRTDASVLNALTGAPRRVTELAELEGLAQPTMTLLVQRLEQRGWVKRKRHADADAANAPVEQHVLAPEAVAAPTIHAVAPEEPPGLRIVPAG